MPDVKYHRTILIAFFYFHKFTRVC